MGVGEEDNGDRLADRLLAKGVPRDEIAERHALSRLEAHLLGRAEEPLKLARYALLRRLGAGGSGVVYAAFDPELDRQVAIKLLRRRDARAGTTEEAHARLLREAQALARLSHPNVVTVYDVGTYDAREHADAIPEVADVGDRGVFIVMEMVVGINILEWTRIRKRPLRDVLRVLCAAGRGLESAHAAGLVHRDVKPSNVLVGPGEAGERWRVHVLDFGLATVTPLATVATLDPSASSSGAQLTITREGAVMGTPSYMAPEQHSAGLTDARTDQYGFCVMAYELLYGVRPFAGRSVEALARLKARGQVPEPPESSDVPARIRATILRGLSPLPADRFDSMQELLGKLEADPDRKRRRRRIVAASLVGGALTLGGALYVGARSAASVCDGQEALWTATWSADVKGAVQAAFVGTGKPYAADAWSAVQRDLEAYGTEWVASRTDACRATLVDRQQSKAVMDRRYECLDLRLGQVEALATMLTDADGELVERAVAVAEALPQINACDNDGQSDRDANVDPAIVAALDNDLATAQALSAAARFDEVLERLDSAVQRAEAAGLTLHAARGKQLRGKTLADAGRAEEAKTALQAALVSAEAAGDNELAIWVLGELVRVNGRLLEDHEEAQFWGRLAMARLERRQLEDELLARVAYEIASAAYMRGRLDESYDAHARALAIREVVFSPNDPKIAIGLNGQGLVLLDKGQPVPAQHLFERSLEIVKERFGPAHPEFATVLNNIALAQSAQGDPAAAAATLEQVLKIREAALGEDHPMIPMTLSNLGIQIYEQGRYEDALAVHQRAIEIARRVVGPNHPTFALALSNAATTLHVLGRNEQAIDTNRTVLEIYTRRLAPDDPRRALPRINLASVYNAENRHEEALRHAELAMRQWERAHGADHNGNPVFLYVTGVAAAGTGDVDRGIALLERAKAIVETGHSPGNKADVEATLAELTARRDGVNPRSSQTADATPRR